MKKALLALVLFLAGVGAIFVNFSDFDRFKDRLLDRNTVYTTTGKVRLGKVYSEKFIVSYELLDEKGETIISGDGAIDGLVNDFDDKLKLKSWTYAKDRDNAVITGKSSLKVSTYLVWQSEYQPVFRLEIYKSSMDYPSGEKPKEIVKDIEAMAKVGANIVKEERLNFL